MGSSVSAMINKQQGELKAQAQDQLNALLTMADLKFTAFMDSVKDRDDSSTIPIDKILVMDHSVHAGVTNNADNIKNAVTNAGKAFASGHVLDGITGIVSVGLDAVLGNVAANQSEHTTYAITCGELGGVMRVDINIFCYTYTATALTKVTNNVVAVAYTISSVDTSKLDSDTLRNIVQVCYSGAATKAQMEDIYKQLVHAMKADNPIREDVMGEGHSGARLMQLSPLQGFNAGSSPSHAYDFSGHAVDGQVFGHA